jgi:hypothetical protein
MVVIRQASVLRKYFRSSLNFRRPCRTVVPCSPIPFRTPGWTFITSVWTSSEFLGSLLQSRVALATENLFLRKQPALYQERQLRPRRATDATRLTMGCFPSSIVGRIGVKIWVTIGYSQISPHQF